MMRALTKSDSPGVNGFFFVSLVSTLASCALAPTLAWLRQSDVAFAVESSATSFLLWWVVLGAYRLIRG
jgi:hypothetical protein